MRSKASHGHALTLRFDATLTSSRPLVSGTEAIAPTASRIGSIEYAEDALYVLYVSFSNPVAFRSVLFYPIRFQTKVVASSRSSRSSRCAVEYPNTLRNDPFRIIHLSTCPIRSLTPCLPPTRLIPPPCRPHCNLAERPPH